MVIVGARQRRPVDGRSNATAVENIPFFNLKSNVSKSLDIYGGNQKRLFCYGRNVYKLLKYKSFNDVTVEKLSKKVQTIFTLVSLPSLKMENQEIFFLQTFLNFDC